MGDYVVTGADQFGDLARRLKQAGDKELRSELYKGINRAVKPMKADIKEHVGYYMPARYAAVLRGSLSLTISKRANKTTPGVTLKAKSRGARSLRKVGSLDAGKLEHPLYGNRKHWFTTTIKPGFFTHESEQRAPEVREAIVSAMNDVAEKVAKK